MLAEAATGPEQKAVDRIVAKERRSQGVVEGFAMKPVEQGGDVPGIVTVRGAQLARKGQRSRVGMRFRRRQAQVFVDVVLKVSTASCRIGVAQTRCLLVAQRLGDRCTGEQLLIAGKHRVDVGMQSAGIVVRRGLRKTAGEVQREQPRFPVRLERDRINRGPTLGARERPGPLLHRQRPFAAIENRQHRPAPVALPGGRYRAVEIDTESNGVGE